MTTPSIPELIASIAEKEVGTKEQGNNGGQRIADYQSATWLPIGPWAWCAAFVCWVVKQAIRERKITFDRPRTAGAWDFERWCLGEDNSVKLKKSHNGDIQRGDIVIFRFSHIGIATGPPDSLGRVPTVEGNTNPGGEREGDGVYRKLRPLAKIRSRIRFAP